VVEFLDEQKLRQLLGDWLSGDRQARIKTIRELLGGQARKSRRRVFDRLYAGRERSDDSLVRRLKLDYPGHSTSTAEELLHNAEPSYLQHMREKPLVPLTLA